MNLSPKVARLARPVAFGLAAVVTLVALAVWVFPTRTWLDQRSARAEAQVEIAELDAERAELEERITLLETEAEIERLARSEYGLVEPGEEAYAILAAPTEPFRFPPIWPWANR